MIESGLPIEVYPAINAGLNALSGVLLATGRWFIARRNQSAHIICMLGALTSSSFFLMTYLYYHFIIRDGQVTRFEGEGLVRIAYFTILLTHTVAAACVLPMVVVTVHRAWRGRFDKHKRIARWTFPVWMYVSVTGVIVYFMLYHL